MENQLPFALFENKLTSDPDDYTAQVQSVGTVNNDDLIAEMTSRGSTLTAAEARSFLEEYELALKKKLLAGYAVNTPLFNISPSIVGVFNGRDDSFDPSRHTVRINITPGVKLRAMEAGFSPVKNESIKPAPVPMDYKDVATGLTNQVITPGGVGQLSGNRLNFDEADATQGIFLIGADNTAVRVTTMVHHKPALLIFMVPTGLAGGNYHIEVRAAAKNSKDVRTGRLPNDLVVR